MAKKANVEDIIDDSALELQEVPMRQTVGEQPTEKVTRVSTSRDNLINCLRNERVIVRHIDKQTGMVTDPRHVLYGGMAENAKRTFTVPLLKSGMLCDVLTKDEKNYLETVLGLEPNAMSVYKKENNFWSSANENGISNVTLYKQDNYLDLSTPVDYIKYKILLANKDRIAPSPQALQDTPKATYEFVIISENDTTKLAKANMTLKMQCYKEYGKIEDDADKLRLIIETIDGRPLSSNTKIDVLQTKINDLIQANSRLFLKIVTDELLPTKVLIKKAIEAGIIAKRGDFLYLRSGNTTTPLCNDGQEPTLNVAAKYLNEPKHQELKFSIEAKIK